MENENEELETELETELGEEGEGASASESSAGVDGALPGADAGTEGGGDEKDGAGAGPKSLAEALELGLEAVSSKAKEKAGEKDGKPGEEKNPDGTPKVAKEGEGVKKPDDGAKKPDHVNDPIPAGVAERTRERIVSLVDEVKQLRDISDNQGQMISAVMDSGASPQEFGAMVQYLHWVHSDKPDDLESAYKLLSSELEGVALKLGRPLPGVDFLTGHDDLVKAVQEGLTTREMAVELAMGRKRTAREQATKTATTAATAKTENDTAALALAKNEAIEEINELGKDLAKEDPQYKVKFDALVPELKEKFKTLHPSKWKAAFLERYAKHKVAAPAKAAAIVPVNKPKGPQPLRPSSPSGGTVKTPGSALDALSSAIDGMRG